MAKRLRPEELIARWTVDAAEWRAFVEAVAVRKAERPREQCCYRPSGEAPAAGVEVEIYETAAFVGEERLSLDPVHNGDIEAVLRPERLEFFSVAENFFFPVPVAAGAVREAARVADCFNGRVAALRRKYEEAEARPTVSNRLRRVVERHFVVFLLLVLFVLIPAGVFVAHLVRSWWRGGS